MALTLQLQQIGSYGKQHCARRFSRRDLHVTRRCTYTQSFGRIAQNHATKNGGLTALTYIVHYTLPSTHTTLLSYTRAYTYSSLFGLSYPTPCCVIFVCIKSMKVILPVFIVFNFFTIFIIQKTPYQLITAIIMLNILQQQKSACLYIVF